MSVIEFFLVSAAIIINKIEIKLGFILLVIIYQAIILSKSNKGFLQIFKLIFICYIIFYPMVWLIEGEVISGFESATINEAINLYLKFMLALSIGYSMTSIAKKDFETEQYIQNTKITYNLLIFMTISLLFLYSFSAIQVIQSGGITKEERMTAGTASFQTFHGGLYVLIGAYYLKAKDQIFKKKHLLYFGLVAVVLIMLYPILEERDEFILPILFISLIAYSEKKISPVSLIKIGIYGLIIFTTAGYIRSLNDNNINILFALSQNEFIFSMRNLVYIITNQVTLTENTLIGDLLSISGYGKSGVSWFNDNVYENKGLGLIGELYLNMGEIGIYSIGLTYGYCLRYIDNSKSKSFVGIIFKILLFLALLYTIRSDLAIVTSTIVKKFALMIIVIKILEISLKKTKYEEN